MRLAGAQVVSTRALLAVRETIRAAIGAKAAMAACSRPPADWNGTHIHKYVLERRRAAGK